MPGLIGFTDKHNKYSDRMLLNMRNLLKHSDSYIDEEIYSDNNIYASRTHLGIINPLKQPFTNDNLFLWMEGEFYNQDELRSRYSVTSNTDGELLIAIYKSTKSFEFLRYIDGYYAAVLYDKKENKIYLITDRYGLKFLYWGIINGDLVWSSEVKGFLGHINFKPVINRKAVEEFFDIGYLLENRTWFEGIELVPPASILTFDFRKSMVAIQHYWSWSEIKPIKEPIDEGELSEELGQLFIQSVHNRVSNNERIGVSLSGGLDSRAILAAVPEDYKPLHAFTFGQEGCDDIGHATRVAKIKGAVHHSFNISHENWFEKRVENVWITDGNLNLLHIHALQSTFSMSKSLDINLNGFAGDLVLGGSYLTLNNLEKKIDSKIVNDITKCKMEIKNFSDWYLIDKTDPYFINNRVRRFTNAGTISLAQVIEQRKPFFDNNLIELVYGIPDTLRYKSYIYNKMLLKTFPEYYNNIPWQKTGCPISYPKWATKLFVFKKKCVNKLKIESCRCGFNFSTKELADYPALMRQEPAKSFFEKLLLSKRALYPEYINRNKVQGYLKNHMSRRANYHDELCLALTLELWLRQVFENEYRE